jgi:transketolase
MGAALDQDWTALEAVARRVRATCIQMAHDGREGHLNGSLSCVEILLALYTCWLRVDPEQPCSTDRDRLILSKGHAVTALYAVLAERGFMPAEWLSRYAQNDTALPPHPCRHALPLLECSSGSLGQGLGVGTGMAYGLRLDTSPARVAVVMSDGECNEGSVWEAATFATAHRLDNLVMVVDYNGVQSVGRSDALMGQTSLEDKFRAFGWAAQTIDGHSLRALADALAQVPFTAGRPSAIIARTIAGAGVSFMQDTVLWHYRVPSEDDLRRAHEELSATPLHGARHA